MIGHSQPLFFVFYILQLVYKILPMSGFEPRISGVGCDRSTNWATNIPHFSINVGNSSLLIISLEEISQRRF